MSSAEAHVGSHERGEAPQRIPETVPAYVAKVPAKTVFYIMLAATFVTSAAQAMLSTALPAIMEEFAVDASMGNLLTTGYIYVLGILSVLTAFLIQRFDIRKLFLAAVACFVLGSALAWVAPSYYVLLAARFLQAGGNGVLIPLVQTVAVSVYPKERHGFALGLVGMVIGFAPAVGPSIAGIIVQEASWRMIFVLLGGFAALALAASFFTVRGEGAHYKVALDLKSCLLFIPGLVLLLVGVTLIEQRGLYDASCCAILCLAGFLLIAFCHRQLHLGEPVLKVQLFRGKHVILGVALCALAQIAMVAGSVQLPLYMQELHGISALEAGLVLLPGSILMAFASPVVGSFYDRHGMRVSATVGLLALAAGTLSFALFDQSTPEWVIGLLYCVRMVGLAFLMMPMTAYALEKLSGPDVAHGTAIVNSLRQIVGSLGSSVLVASMAAATQALEPNAPTAAAGVSLAGLHASFAMQVVLTLFVLACVLLIVTPLKKKPAKA